LGQRNKQTSCLFGADAALQNVIFHRKPNASKLEGLDDVQRDRPAMKAQWTFVLWSDFRFMAVILLTRAISHFVTPKSESSHV
jgi:hypothetical protein